MMLTLDKDRRVESLVKTPFSERNPEISPNGLWLAYESNESGQYEIHVRPFPDVDSDRDVVSTAGGTRPLWARSGRELFYVAPSGAMMTVPIEQGPTWKAGTAARLFDWAISAVTSRSYDVSGDGRFLMLKPVAASESTPAPASLVVIQNLDAELRRLAPAN
jgi:serine/threonine-protein kinase